ncbi:lantibiotic dehydratase C-terminal domain-containing protein [Streptomyces sp. NPDC048361]|uniref:lantibiotic dehydratase C-terminal domain-containing protein n=1 Tax=Streptomyces sp. NPDC048361 TaxID=3154720 RepID=UPI003427126C
MTAIPQTEAPQWRAAHIAYFGDDIDQLILDAVRPVIERCAGHAESAYVLRHWRRGPHLRLVVRATPTVFDELVVPAVSGLIGGHLRRRPSTAAPLDEAALLPLHRRLAAAEREPGPLTPFYADNSIVWEEHDRRVDVLGCPVGADELALFYEKTNGLLFEHLESVAVGVPRETLALRLMLATAHTLCRHPQDPSIRRGFVSFRSHAEGYLSTVGPDVRAAFDRRYAANRATLTTQVRAVVAAFDSTAPAAASGADEARALHRWVATIDPLDRAVRGRGDSRGGDTDRRGERRRRSGRGQPPAPDDQRQRDVQADDVPGPAFPALPPDAQLHLPPSLPPRAARPDPLSALPPRGRSGGGGLRGQRPRSGPGHRRERPGHAGAHHPVGADRRMRTTSSAPPSDAYPPSAETGGMSARRYHARHGSVLPAIDPAASNTAPKHHPGAPVLTLPFPPAFPAPSDDRDPAAAGPERLGAVLALLNGVTRIEWTGAGARTGRPVPSGGGAYPGEVYAATGCGLFHYLPSAHALELLSRADLRTGLTGALDRPPTERPECVLLITSRLDANLARYGPFGHRLQALDTGVLTGQALTLLESAGATPMTHVRFAAEEVGRLLGLNSRVEHVHSVITARSPGAIAPERALLRRRTARSGFEPAPIALGSLLTVLEEAVRPIPLDHAPPAGCDVYVVAQRVTGLDAGCHRRDPRTGRLVPVTAGVTPRGLFPPGGPGEAAGFEAACAVLVTGDYEAGYPLYGDRWYRMLNLRAGVIGQRIGLAAARTGLGAGLRCDVDVTAADAVLRAHPHRTTLLAALLGPERGGGTPTSHLFAPPGRIGSVDAKGTS